jgi:hypothetical protein
VPLTWQSAYFKAAGVIASFREVLYYIRSVNKQPGNYTIKINTFDEQKTYNIQSEVFAIGANDYDTDGYCILRVLPRIERVLGFSVALETNVDMTILSVDANIDLVSEAVVSASNTR